MKAEIRFSMIISLIFSLLLFFTAPVSGKPLIRKGEPVRIGIIGPMAMKTGLHMLISAKMCVEKLNAEGGVEINGEKHPIELIKIDSNEFVNVADAANAAERAINRENIHFLIGGVLDEAVAVIQELAADNQIIYIDTSYTVSGNHMKRLKKEYDRYKYCFTTSSAGPAALGAAHIGIVTTIAQAVKKCGVEKPRVAQLVGKSRPGDMIVAYASKIFPERGMVVVGAWRPSNLATDLRAETAAIQSAKPHVIYAAFSGSAGMVFGKQVNEIRLPAIVGGSPASSNLKNRGIDYAVSLMSPITISKRITDKNVAFVEAFAKRTSNELCIINTGDVIAFLLQAVEKTNNLSADPIIKYLETEQWAGVAGDIEFDPKSHITVFLNNYRATYGVQSLPGGKQAIVWPTENTKVPVDPITIPEWMKKAWQ